jgi:hydrogenase maturation protease
VRRILVAGIGNVFLGDDAFGVEVIGRLRALPWPEAVDVVDFGIRGIDLAYAMPEYEAVVLVDVVSRGGSPGSLYVLEPTVGAGEVDVQLHSMTPDRVLQWLAGQKRPDTVRIVGCEPATFGEEGFGQSGLSEAVELAIPEAVRLVQSLVQDLLTSDVLHA